MPGEDLILLAERTLGNSTPVGDHHHTPERGGSRRLGERTCLRQGCGRVFQAGAWNQRYCQEAVCQAEVERWQAAKRQEHRRSTEEGKLSHCQAERERRRRKAAAEAAAAVEAELASRAAAPLEQPTEPAAEPVTLVTELAAEPVKLTPEPVVVPVTEAQALPTEPTSNSERGHAATQNPDSQLCDRPGCWGGAPKAIEGRRSFCSDECGRAVRRVEDRERKWLARQDFATRARRGRERQRAHRRRAATRSHRA